MWIMDILGSAGFGAITGGLFGWLGKREERANMQMKFEHEIGMVTARTNASIQIAQMGIEEAKNIGLLAVEKLEAKAFQTSQMTVTSFAANLKSMIRPVILALLLYQTYMINQALEQIIQGMESFDPAEALAIYRLVVLSIIGLTGTAVGWYFAARTSKQFDKLLDKWTVG